MIGKQRIRVGCAVVKILIVNVAMENGYGALLAKLEAGVRRDVKSFGAVVRSNSDAIVLARVVAGDFEPVSNYVDWFTEINCDGRVVRRVESVGDWLCTGDPWTKLNDRRRSSWVRRTRLEVVAILVCVLSAVEFSEQRVRVA